MSFATAFYGFLSSNPRTTLYLYSRNRAVRKRNLNLYTETHIREEEHDRLPVLI